MRGVNNEPATDLACPECGAKVPVSVDDLAEESARTCPNGHEFRPPGQATSVARKVQKSRDDMLRSMREPGQ